MTGKCLIETKEKGNQLPKKVKTKGFVTIIGFGLGTNPVRRIWDGAAPLLLLLVTWRRRFG